jgi:hypothetical protein
MREEHSISEVLDSERMHSSKGEGPEQGQLELHQYIMLGISGHGHVLLCACKVLDSELMHSSEGEGLEQGQRGLCRDVLLGVGGHGHVLFRTHVPSELQGCQ